MSRFVVNAGWSHAPHLNYSEAMRQEMEEIKKSTPPHLLEARTEGKPTLGSGSVFPIPEKEIVILEKVELQPTWRRCYGMDVGWNCTAAVFLAHDTDADVVYVYDCYKAGKKEPELHAAHIKYRFPTDPPLIIPGAIDPSAEQRSKIDGRQLFQLYRKNGLKLMEADNTVETGIAEMWSRLNSGRLKVLWNSNTAEWIKEYLKYRRDEHGRIVKNDDHLMDSCFDESTEVLTYAGWKFWPDVAEEDVFATVNLETDTLEYQKSNELVEMDWGGPMIHFRNKAEQLVTPNHRMVVRSRSDNYKTLRIKRADEVTIWDKLVKTAGTWKGTDLEVPLTDEVSPEDFAEVVGWWVAEGCLMHGCRANPRRKAVSIAQIKPETTEQLRELLDRFPHSWYYDGGAFQASYHELYDYLKPLGHARDKYVPQEIKDAPANVIRGFLRGYFAGDGWVQNGVAQCSASVSKRLSDDIQELMLKTGRCSNILVKPAQPYFIEGRGGDNTRDQYWTYECTTKTAMLRDSENTPNFAEVYYEGKVYCAQVPNGTLVVRRNGKISISGNTRYGIMTALRYAVSPALSSIPSRRIVGARNYF